MLLLTLKKLEESCNGLQVVEHPNARRVVTRTGLLQGKTIGIAATTLEANAAMKSIVRNKRGNHRACFMSSFLVSLAVGIFTSVM